jgi:hypothetical protein
VSSSAGSSPPAELTLDTAGIAPLRDPVLLVALSGYFDVAGVATAALDYIVDDDRAVIVGDIDPDPFYDFTVERPTVEVVEDDDGSERREIVWPSNQVRCVRTGAAHDLVALNGVEPHVLWPTYVRCVMTAVERLGVGLVVTLGAAPDTTPHTRMPVVVGSTADVGLARRLALSPPGYQGVTGVVGVLHSALEAAGVTSVSLRVGVPHYLPAGEHPRAVVSLVRHVSHVIDVPLAVDLRESIGFWDEQHTAAIGDDEQLRGYVQMLEVDYDRRADNALASGGDLAARFEQFLRDGSDSDPPDGAGAE